MKKLWMIHFILIFEGYNYFSQRIALDIRSNIKRDFLARGNQLNRMKNNEELQWWERARIKADESGLSDAQIASKIQISKTSISNWFSGKRNAKLEMKIKIAKLFDISLHWLETGEEEIKPSHLPLLNVETLANYIESGIWKNSDICLDKNDIKDSFLLYHNNDSMTNRHLTNNLFVPEKSIVQISRNRKPECNTIVLIKHENKYLLRKWDMIDSDTNVFSLINHKYNTLTFSYIGDVKDILIGTVIGFKFQLCRF